MMILYKDPDGKKIFSTNNGLETTVTVSDMELEKHCAELENRLSKYEVISLPCIESNFRHDSYRYYCILSIDITGNHHYM